MRNSTLLALALLIAPAGMTAQSLFNPKKFQKPLLSKPETAMKAAQGARMAKTRAAAAGLTLPCHEEAYSYEDGAWEAYATYDITYDSRGNVLSETETSDGEYTRTVNTWNSDNMRTSKIVSYSSDGESYTDNSKLLCSYDPKVKSLITESMEYYWQDEAWTLVSAGKTYKRIITRDASGNVTRMELQTYYNGAYETLYKTATTYGSDGKAAAIRFEELDTDDGTTYEMMETGTLTGIVWQDTDGQIVSYEESELFTGSNRIKSANVTFGGAAVGTLSVAYDDNGGYEAVASYTADDPQEAVMRLEYTDGNGSYTYSAMYYEGDPKTLTESEKRVCEFDSHGNCTLEESYYDGELEYAVKTEYTYVDGSDYPSEQIQSEYDSETGEYEPAFKVVSSDYRDVTSVKAVAADDANAPQAVYTTGGVRVGESASRLPRGLYIVKKGAKAVKTLRR